MLGNNCQVYESIKMERHSEMKSMVRSRSAALCDMPTAPGWRGKSRCEKAATEKQADGDRRNEIDLSFVLFHYSLYYGHLWPRRRLQVSLLVGRLSDSN